MAAKAVLFRWSVWNADSFRLEMLRASVGTFRAFFGEEARYVVFTDNVKTVRGNIQRGVEVVETTACSSQFWDERSTWRKWAPRFRYVPLATEIFVDIDLFLLRDPIELREFIAGNGVNYLSCHEEFYSQRPYGLFSSRIDHSFYPVNSGLLGQRIGCDLSSQFNNEYLWWRNKVDSGIHVPNYHDEQGAIAFMLQRHIKTGIARVLDASKYRIVCPWNLDQVEVAELVAMHATDHGHPAYRRYRSMIQRISELGND